MHIEVSPACPGACQLRQVPTLTLRPDDGWHQVLDRVAVVQSLRRPNQTYIVMR